MKTEAPVVKNIMLEASRLGMRLFRNNRGLFRTLDGERKVRAGLEAAGASDLIGMTPVVITPEMVGQTVAVFTAVEVKKPSWKSPKTETEIQQQTFIDFVNSQGGIAHFLNNAEKLKQVVDYVVECNYSGTASKQ